MDSLNLSRQRQLQDHRKVLCELGVPVKKTCWETGKNREKSKRKPGDL